MSQIPFKAQNGIVSGNLSVNTTTIVFGTDVTINTTALLLSLSGANTVVNRTTVSVTNSTSNVNIIPNQISFANSTTTSNVNLTGLYSGNSSVNAIVNGTNIVVGGIATINSTGAYVPNVNAASFTVGTNFTANATLVNAAALNVVNQTNTGTLFVTTSSNVGANVVSNSTGVWVIGTVNATTVQTGTGFTTNATLTNAAALNVVNQTNTGSLFVTTAANVGVNVVANATGVWVIGTVNATTLQTGTAFTANSTIVNAQAINAVSLYTTTSVNVGSGPFINSTAYSVGNTIANSTVITTGNTLTYFATNSSFLSVGNTTASAFLTQTSVGVGANVSIGPAGIFIGNSSVNTTLASTGVSVNGNQLLPATINLGISIGDGTNIISTGATGRYIGPFDFGGTITQWSIIGQESGSISIDIWKCTYSQFDSGSTHPVAADKISASAPITYSSAKKAQSSTLTGWTTTFSAGDILAFNVSSVTSSKLVTIMLKVTKTS